MQARTRGGSAINNLRNMAETKLNIEQYKVTLDDPNKKLRTNKVQKVNMYVRTESQLVELSFPTTEEKDKGKNPVIYEAVSVSCRAHKDGVKFRILADINIKNDQLTDEIIDKKTNAFRVALRKVKSLKGEA